MLSSLGQYRFWIVLLSVLSLSLLSGCSHLHKKGMNGRGEGDYYGDQGRASSKGIGDDSQFGDADGANSRLAGHNQTYYFSYDDNTVKQEDYASIRAQAQYLKNHPEARVILEGNTDERGSREYNLALGERRSDAVSDILQMAGVPTRQILVVSYGQERPLVSGHNESAFAKNRRVELKYCTSRSGKCFS